MADVRKLEAVLREIGLWDAQGPDGRYRYRYRLIPGRFTLTSDMQGQLNEIAEFVGYGLTRMARAIADIEKERVGTGKLPPHTAAFMRALKSSCGGYGFYPEDAVVPPIVKVDLMWDGQTLKIAEIDAYNPRGMAYAIWIREVHVMAGETDAVHFDLPHALLEQTEESGRLVWLYSDRERYYAPVMECAAHLLTQYGVMMRVVGERDLTGMNREDGRGLLSCDERLVIVPDRMHQNIAFRDAVVAFARKHPERLVMPMAPHLGSKVLLAALGATFTDDLGVLDFTKGFEFCELANRFLPQTYILGKQFAADRLRMNGGEYVMKTLAGSGAKGIFLPDDRDYDVQLIAALSQKQPAAVAQEVVWQVPIELAGESGLERHFIRLTTYVEPTAAGGRILDAEVTGTGLDPLVHGGPECVQLPVFFPN